MSTGRLTDDSEMTITIIRSLIRNRGYQRDDIVQSYLNWANLPGNQTLGRNTRRLFKGVKTIKGYEKRYQQVLAEPLDKRSQSNGPLMRCTPFALLSDLTAAYTDCMLTNPHPICVDANFTYITALKAALQHKSRDEIWTQVLATVQSDVLKKILQDVIIEPPVIYNVNQPNKGWVLYAFWCAMFCLYHYQRAESSMNFADYQSAIDFVILLKGDTDTNAAITGGLMGAVAGYDQMMAHERTNYNIRAIRSVDNTVGRKPKPAIYGIADFDWFTSEIVNLFG